MEKDIDKRLDINQDAIDDLSKGILGYGRTIQDIISPDIDSVNFDTLSINRSQTIGHNLFGMTGRDKLSKYQINERLYDSVANRNYTNYAELTSILQGRARLNSEMNYILNEMPELELALNTLANDIVYPNVSSTSGIKIEFVGNDESNDNESRDALIKFFKHDENPINIVNNKRMYSYNIDEDVQEIVRYFGLYGHMIVCTIPYKKIVQDLLYSKVGVNEAFSSPSEVADIIKKAYSEKTSPRAESIRLDELDIVSDNIRSDIKSILIDTPYSESDVEYVLHLLQKNEASLFTDYKEKKMDLKGDIGSLLKPVSEDGRNSIELSSIEAIKAKRKRKFNINNMIGCTHDILDPSRTIPVYVKDELLGVYVVSDDIAGISAVKLGGNLANLMGASNINDRMNNMSRMYQDKLKSIVFKDIRDILHNNLDKNMLKNNPNLIEDIEYILENNDFNSKPIVKFIPSEFLTLHKIGPGPLGTPMLLKARRYAHMYIDLLKSDMVSKMYFEKPRWIVKVPYDGNNSVEARVMQVIESFRHSLPRITDVGIPASATNSSSMYHTTIVPLSPNEKEQFQIDQLPASNTVDNTEYIKQLRNQATSVIGYPADLFDPNASVDFAKKIANINMNVLIRVLSIQKNLSISLSELCTKRIRYMTGNNNIEVLVTFEKPSDLEAASAEQMFNSKNQLSDIMGAIVDKMPNIDPAKKELIKQYINKNLLEGVVDLGLIYEAIEKVELYDSKAIGEEDIE